MVHNNFQFGEMTQFGRIDRDECLLIDNFSLNIMALMSLITLILHSFNVKSNILVFMLYLTRINLVIWRSVCSQWPSRTSTEWQFSLYIRTLISLITLILHRFSSTKKLNNSCCVDKRLFNLNSTYIVVKKSNITQ